MTETPLPNTPLNTSSTDPAQADAQPREIRALIEVFKSLTLPLELPDLLQQVLDKMIDLLEPAQAGMILLWDQAAGVLRPFAAQGVDFMILKQMKLQPGESITGKVFQDGKARLYTNREEIMRDQFAMRPESRVILTRALGGVGMPISAVSAPISTAGQRFGVLILDTKSGPPVFETEDLFLVQTLAELMAMAIDRERLEAAADAIRAGREEQQMRFELMASLSHELRLPLTAIKGYSTALLLDQVDWDLDKRKEFLRKIDHEVDTMQGMIKDLMDSSLLEVQQLKPEKEPVRLQYISRDIAQELGRQSDRHTIIDEMPADLPLVSADPRWIKQVFRNLVDNAIKYSPDGGTIRISGEARPNQVVVCIEDHGIGIPPEDLIPIFDKFTRARSPRNFRIPGTGLGLPLSRAVIEVHGGRLWVDSKVGQGTSAYFSLPLDEDLLVEDDDA